jgi:ABC-2 type transport system permease protein
MAVYEQSYHRYEGDHTSRALRFLVIPRYAWHRLSGSKMLWALLVASVLVTLVFMVIIYLRHNAAVLLALDLQVAEMLPINGRFFEIVTAFQLVIGFLVVVLAGPALISMDLANGALPLYLSRPLSRREYVLGKMSVIAAALLLMTCVLPMLLWLLQASLAGDGWALDNLRIAAAIFGTSCLWIVVLSSFTLALSALIKWPLAVRAVMLVFFVVLPVFGLAVSEIIDKDWGMVLGLWGDMAAVRAAMFGTTPAGLPPLGGAVVVIVLAVALSIAVIAARLRAQEVVT